jgi:S1-C subfamily serine protease
MTPPIMAAALAMLLQILLVGTGSAQASDAAAPAEPVARPLPEPSTSARELFARTRDGIVQVRVLLASANEQSSLGSGFVVRDDLRAGAWVVTNYHVVADLAIDPIKYRIELRGTNERRTHASLVAIDVIHDLALLRIDPMVRNDPWQTFPLREDPLAQGAKVFALGNPLELGFLISEGIYNGKVEAQLYDQMLFSGALNSGMSGGPAIDAAGRVVGVNVATRRDGESLSFLVPVRFVRDMLARSASARPRREWRTEIAQQLLQHQEFVTRTLLDAADRSGRPANFTTQKLSGRVVPTLGGALPRCWADTRRVDEPRFLRERLRCNLKGGLFVNRRLTLGDAELDHVFLRNISLSTPQFLDIDSSSPAYFGPAMARFDQETTRDECRADFVRGAERVYRVSMCVNAYRKFPGLYRYRIDALQVDDVQQRLKSQLELDGFSFENATRITQAFLERLR